MNCLHHLLTNLTILPGQIKGLITNYLTKENKLFPPDLVKEVFKQSPHNMTERRS